MESGYGQIWNELPFSNADWEFGFNRFNDMNSISYFSDQVILLG